MAKIAWVLVLSLAVVLSIQSMVEAAETGEEASWTGLAEDQLRSFGLGSPEDPTSAPAASTPASAPGEAQGSSSGQEPAAAPMAN